MKKLLRRLYALERLTRYQPPLVEAKVRRKGFKSLAEGKRTGARDDEGPLPSRLFIAKICTGWCTFHLLVGATQGMTGHAKKRSCHDDRAV